MMILTQLLVILMIVWLVLYILGGVSLPTIPPKAQRKLNKKVRRKLDGIKTTRAIEAELDLEPYEFGMSDAETALIKQRLKAQRRGADTATFSRGECVAKKLHGQSILYCECDRCAPDSLYPDCRQPNVINCGCPECYPYTRKGLDPLTDY